MRIFFLLLLTGLFTGLQAQNNPPKIDPELWDRLVADPNGAHAALVMLANQVNADALLQEMEGSGLPLDVRNRTVILRLQDEYLNTQPTLWAKLANLPGFRADQAQSLWIVNAVIVQADKTTIERIAAFPEVGMIYADYPVEALPPTGQKEAYAIPNGTEPGLRAINAPFMWNLGYTGYGRKVLVIDSGEYPEHPAIRENYWGHNVPKAQAWNGSAYPEDCAEHGTHVTGVICGLDRKTNDTIGVAYNARWMGGPQNFPIGPLGCSVPFTQTTYDIIQNLQWALNPDGQLATSDDVPDVINCSIGSSANLCNSGMYLNMFTTMEAAGIPVIWAAGNSGPSASTVDGEASIAISEVNTFAVGAVDGANANFPIAGFSSRGPSECSGTGSIKIKPEVVAPGVSVRSALAGSTGYTSFDGTSFAAPHVSGALALLREAFPNASGIVLKQALYNTAIDLGTAGEDNTYGKGMIDLGAAYQYLINQGLAPVAPVSAERDAILLNITINGVCNGPVDIAAEVENAGAVPFTSMSFRYGIINGNELTYTWNGNLQRNQFTTVVLPNLPTPDGGEYEYFVEITQVNGQNDLRNLNNQFRRRHEKYNAEYPEASVSAKQSLPVCAGSRVVLGSDLTPGNGEDVEWYSSPTSINPLHTGETFVTPALNSTTTYYVTHTKNFHLGKVNSGATTTTSLDKGLLFNALQPFLLRSVEVNAAEAGGRIIELKDKTGKVIASKTAILKLGVQRVELNFNVPAGDQHRLNLNATGKGLAFSAGTNYPYTFPNVVSITGSDGSNLFYYYFYDWEVSAQSVCGRIPVQVTVNNSASATPVAIQGPDTVYISQGGTAQFADATPGATNQDWDFGNGQTSTQSTPSATYTIPGEYNVVLFNRNNAGCTNAGQKTVTVLQTSSATFNDPYAGKFAATLYPNPVTNELFIKLTDQFAATTVDIAVYDMFGRRVLFNSRQSTGGQMLRADAQSLLPGVYILSLEEDGKSVWRGKFAKN